MAARLHSGPLCSALPIIYQEARATTTILVSLRIPRVDCFMIGADHAGKPPTSLSLPQKLSV